MKKITHIIIVTGLIMLGHVTAYSQRMAIEKAESYLNTREYKNAIPLLEELSTYKASDTWQYQLGYCYIQINAISKADSTFAQIKNIPTGEYYLQFGEVKQRLGLYNEALTFFEIYKEKNKLNEHIDNKINSCKYALAHTQKNTWNVQPNESFLRGIYTGGCYYNNSLWLGFDDSRTENTTPSHNLYASNADTYFTEYIPNDQLLISKYDIGGISFGKENGEVVYSIQDSEVSETNDKKLASNNISQHYLNTLNLFRGIYNGEEIVAIEPFPFNSKEYSCMHPAISDAGNTCYFSSDMPGGHGGFDIYKMEKLNSTWSKPVNMGELINTKADEMYPYEFHDSILYFSSNGLAGYGGADIFKTNIYNQQIQIPINIGLPANSSADDFGINFTSPHTGYLFSNRASAPGTDGLFSFDFPVVIDYDTTNGFILDAFTQEPLSNVRIAIRGTDSSITFLHTDSLGSFNFNKMLPNKNYTVTANKEKYHEKKMEITSSGNGTLKLELDLDPVLALNSIFTLYNILFEYNDYRLTQASMLVLDKVANVMIKNPNTTFELGAHTDARGVFNDNLVLSQHRAESTVYYLLSKGVAPKQLVPIGYGEKVLKNKCDGDSHCSEVDHAVNRRVEIKVTAINK